MNKVLKSFLMDKESCPALEAPEVIYSLAPNLMMEGWNLILEREDVREFLRENEEKVVKILYSNNANLPSEFYEFSTSLPGLKNNTYLNSIILTKAPCRAGGAVAN